MFETMYDAMGVGLAANQVGMLKRIVVIDCGDDPHVLINPVIIETAGEQRGYEGCLSVPGKTGVVTRPDYAKVKAYDEDMNEFILEGEGLLVEDSSFNTYTYSSENRKSCIKDRNTQHKHRNNHRHNRSAFYRPDNRHRRKHESQIK